MMSPSPLEESGSPLPVKSASSTTMASSPVPPTTSMPLRTLFSKRAFFTSRRPSVSPVSNWMPERAAPTKSIPSKDRVLALPRSPSITKAEPLGGVTVTSPMPTRLTATSRVTLSS